MLLRTEAQSLLFTRLSPGYPGLRQQVPGHEGGGAHSSTALRPLRSPGLPRPPRRLQILAAAGAALGDRDAAAGTTTQALAEAEPSSPGPRRHERAAARRNPGAVARPRRPVMGSCVSRGEDPAARDAARGGGTSARPRGSQGGCPPFTDQPHPRGRGAPLGQGSGAERAACRADRGLGTPRPTRHPAGGMKQGPGAMLSSLQPHASRSVLGREGWLPVLSGPLMGH